MLDNLFPCMAWSWRLAWCISAALAQEPLLVDRSTPSLTFDGIGGLSGGGATSVLLPHYKEPSRSQILDYLFKPNFGASLQILKVEIGGDSQSTDGTESSHMHTADTVDLNTGYEWWLMKEAKKRNPDIKIYGLAWAFPGWVGNHSGSPFDFPELTARYLVEWTSGAKKAHGVDVDYLGVWNERSSDSTFVQTLRKALNDRGITGTQIVVKDGGSDICDDLAKDKAYAAAVDIIGLHYPSDFQDYSVCHSLGKPIWSSEESSSYDDLNGAACWSRIINAHWVINQMTSNIMWNLVGAYYHGTNWYASSMLTSVEPWSGYYEVNPVIWATAHMTQFTSTGWKYLAKGEGSGELPKGGYYVTLVDPQTSNFTMNIVKISRDHSSCTRPTLPQFNTSAETVIFKLATSMKAPKMLQVWYSNFETFTGPAPLFEHSTVEVKDGGFMLDVAIGAMYSVTTIMTGMKGSFPEAPIPESSPSFPLPYADNLDDVEESQDAKWFADQIGAFEAHHSSDGSKSLKQMVPELPIGWSDHGSNGPMTLMGMREWQDIAVCVSFMFPSVATERDLASQTCAGHAFPINLTDKWCTGLDFNSQVTSPAECREACCSHRYCSVWQWDRRGAGSCWMGMGTNVSDPRSCPNAQKNSFFSEGRAIPVADFAADAICVATRVDQMWKNGIVLCINVEGQWNLTTGGPPLQGQPVDLPAVVHTGQLAAPLARGSWYSLALNTELGSASGAFEGQTLFSNASVRDLDTGFAAFGGNGWWAAEFRNWSITKTNNGWQPPAQCAKPIIGQPLTAAPCARNGLVANDQSWNLLPSFQLEHVGSGLCVSADQDDLDLLTLQSCDPQRPEQLFINDYTLIRNTEVPLTVASSKMPLAGLLSGEVVLADGGADWSRWSYFPNTKQLRNQYVANTKLGYPMCLSACKTVNPELVRYV